jgi:hypothetical protein
VRAKNVLDVVPRLLEGEADGDAKELELELLAGDPGMVALTELLNEESEGADETEELLVDVGTEVVRVLLEVRPLLPKLSELLDKSELLGVSELLKLKELLMLFGLAELLVRLRNEDSELDGDATELLLVDVGTELMLEPAAELGEGDGVLEILDGKGEEVGGPIDRIVSNKGDGEIVGDVGSDVRYRMDEEHVATDITDVVEGVEAVLKALVETVGDVVTLDDVEAVNAKEPEELPILELEMLLVG